jgi:hypothetical protein
MQVLVVTNPFNGFAIGDRITDPAKIKETLESESAHHVVRSDHSDDNAVTKTKRD